MRRNLRDAQYVCQYLRILLHVYSFAKLLSGLGGGEPRPGAVGPCAARWLTLSANGSMLQLFNQWKSLAFGRSVVSENAVIYAIASLDIAGLLLVARKARTGASTSPTPLPLAG